MKEYVMEAKYIPTSMDALIRFLYSVLSLHCDSPRLLSHSFLSSTNRSLSGWVVLRQQCLHQLLFSFLSWLVFLQHLMKIKGCSAPQCILKGTPLKVQEMSSLLIYVFNEYKATVTVTDAGLYCAAKQKGLFTTLLDIMHIERRGFQGFQGQVGKGRSTRSNSFSYWNTGKYTRASTGLH